MDGLFEELTTLTQNCVQQCSEILQTPQSRNNVTAATLFGIYCGVLTYRCYKNHLAQREATRETDTVLAEIEEIPTYQASYTFEAATTERSEILTEPALAEQQSTEAPVMAAP